MQCCNSRFPIQFEKCPRTLEGMGDIYLELTLKKSQLATPILPI